MKKNNMKKLGLLIATACGVQIICASTIKGEEAKANFFSRGLRSVANFFRGTSSSGTLNTAKKNIKINGTTNTGLVFARHKGEQLNIQLKPTPGVDTKYKINIGSSGVDVQKYQNGNLVSDSKSGIRVQHVDARGSGYLNIRDGGSNIIQMKNNPGVRYELNVGPSGANMQMFKNGRLVSTGSSTS